MDHLYQSQCNDAYWHGVFGGLYLPHLRSAVYEHLLQAEYLADKALQDGRGGKGSRRKREKERRQSSWLKIETGDFDRDGREEVMLNSELLNLFIDPADGGRLTELDWKPRSFNLTNTLTRRTRGLPRENPADGQGEGRRVSQRRGKDHPRTGVGEGRGAAGPSQVRPVYPRLAARPLSGFRRGSCRVHELRIP